MAKALQIEESQLCPVWVMLKEARRYTLTLTFRKNALDSGRVPSSDLEPFHFRQP